MRRIVPIVLMASLAVSLGGCNGCGSKSPKESTKQIEDARKQAEEEARRIATAHKQAIESVFAQESLFVEKMYKQYPRVKAHTAPDREVVMAHKMTIDAISRIDLSACPNDFQRSYLHYRSAWHDWYAIQLDYTGLLGTLGGMAELVVTRVNPATKIESALAKVRATRLEVTAIAMKYGVAEPK